ncbi:MAG: hypothetical protein QHH26_13020 [Armatimonadota bacterium]|nr:hypothetical protein [Armatimonadota bacterium]
MANSEFSIALRNYAGVPVVDLVGDINKQTLSKLEDILNKLIRAGHFHVMINLKRAVWQNTNSLSPLAKMARVFQAHYGNLNLIAENNQIDGLLRVKSIANLFRFCTSEGQALTRIRKIPGPTATGVKPSSARLAEVK